jgi:hypothetical protein
MPTTEWATSPEAAATMVANQKTLRVYGGEHIAFVGQLITTFC